MLVCVLGGDVLMTVFSSHCTQQCTKHINCHCFKEYTFNSLFTSVLHSTVQFLV